MKHQNMRHTQTHAEPSVVVHADGTLSGGSPPFFPTKLHLMQCQHLRQAEPCSEFFSYIKRHQLDLSEMYQEIGIFSVSLVKFYQFDDGSLGFDFSPLGDPAAVIEVVIRRTCHGEVYPVVVDMVCWRLGDPEFLATALGPDDGCAVLGAQRALERRGQPLVLYRNSLDWLKAGCHGVVPLKWRAGSWLHNHRGPFVCQDIGHAAEIQQLLGADAHMHQVLVAPSQDRRAA